MGAARQMQTNSSIPWILASIILLIVISAVYIKLRRWEEGFSSGVANAAAPTTTDAPTAATAATAATADADPTFCPAGSEYYVSKQGESNCCEGNVENRRCKGRVVCTLSRPTKTIPSCATVQKEALNRLATVYCPPSMPNFYTNQITGAKGCTASAVGSNGPIQPNMPTCTIGKSTVEDLRDTTSCINQKRLEELACISPDCSKALHKYKEGLPLVLTQTFQVPGTTAAPRMCTDEGSMEIYLDAAEPNWRSAGKPEYNFAMSVEFCKAAKSALIDKKYVQGVSE
jgi:hypothetical protein